MAKGRRIFGARRAKNNARAAEGGNTGSQRLPLQFAAAPGAEYDAANGEGEKGAPHVDQNERPGICFEG